MLKTAHNTDYERFYYTNYEMENFALSFLDIYVKMFLDRDIG